MGGTFGQEVVLKFCARAANRLKRSVFINTTREETILSTRTRAAVKGKVETVLMLTVPYLEDLELIVDAEHTLQAQKR